MEKEHEIIFNGEDTKIPEGLNQLDSKSIEVINLHPELKYSGDFGKIIKLKSIQSKLENGVEIKASNKETNNDYQLLYNNRKRLEKEHGIIFDGEDTKIPEGLNELDAKYIEVINLQIKNTNKAKTNPIDELSKSIEKNTSVKKRAKKKTLKKEVPNHDI